MTMRPLSDDQSKTLDALNRYADHQTGKKPQDERLRLKLVGNHLELMPMTTRDKIKAFFGSREFKLETIVEHLRQNPIPKESADGGKLVKARKAFTHLNKSITSYEGRLTHLFAKKILPLDQHQLLPLPSYCSFGVDAKGVLDQKGDGNCLFRSFATGLVLLEKIQEKEIDAKLIDSDTETHAKYHPYLRKMAVDYISVNKNDDLIKGMILGVIADLNHKATLAYREYIKPENVKNYPEQSAQALIQSAKESYEKEFIDIDENQPDEAIDKYLAKLAHDKFWGSDLEIYALCQIFKVNAKVFMKSEAGDAVQEVRERSIQVDGATGDIQLMYSPNHFDYYTGASS